jgi:hypothetical protein
MAEGEQQAPKYMAEREVRRGRLVEILAIAEDVRSVRTATIGRG